MGTREQKQQVITLSNLVDMGAMTPKMMRLLTLIGRTNQGVLVLGSSNTGRSTLLKAIDMDTYDNKVVLRNKALGETYIIREGEKESLEDAKTVEDVLDYAIKYDVSHIEWEEMYSVNEFDAWLKAWRAGISVRSTMWCSSEIANISEYINDRVKNALMESGLIQTDEQAYKEVADMLDVVILLRVGADGVRRVVRITGVLPNENLDGFIYHKMFEYAENGDSEKYIGVFKNTSVLSDEFIARVKKAGIPDEEYAEFMKLDPDESVVKYSKGVSGWLGKIRDSLNAHFFNRRVENAYNIRKRLNKYR